MTHLRKMMLEELQRRNYAETTIRSYIRIVEDFSRRFQRPPDRLGPQHIREYQAELFKKRKLAASTVTVYLAALRSVCDGRKYQPRRTCSARFGSAEEDEFLY